jgi:hypothetical protein
MLSSSIRSTKQAMYVGDGDLHDVAYNSQRRTLDFTVNYYDPALAKAVDGHCLIYLELYPSALFEDPYNDSLPTVFTVVIAFLFVSMAAIFAVYDRYAISHV